jgi:hypothetical protein
VLALAREPGRGALLAQALQAQAQIAATTGDRETARAASAEAADLLAARLPPQHPLRRRAEADAARFAAMVAPDADAAAGSRPALD